MLQSSVGFRQSYDDGIEISMFIIDNGEAMEYTFGVHFLNFRIHEVCLVPMK